MGNFEKFILQVILARGNDAYGNEIANDMEALKQSGSLPKIYSALEGMEKKGFVTSRQGEATLERGWRPKLYFQVTRLGKEAMNSRPIENLYICEQ